MSGENWTPGPWVPWIAKAICRIEITNHDDTEIVAVLGTGESDNERSKANARLIVAAPDLYAVLSELEESSAYWSEHDVPIGITERISAALKKARGES